MENEDRSKTQKSRREYTLELQRTRGTDKNTTIFDNIAFEQRIGIDTEIFHNFEEFITSNCIDRTVVHRWKSNFALIYHDEKIDSDLYVRHAYILFITRISLNLLNHALNTYQDEKLNAEKIAGQNQAIRFEILNKTIAKWFPFLEVPADYLERLQNRINERLMPFFMIKATAVDGMATFESTDLFNLFYQSMIVPNQRHKLGEFFTPLPLVKLMIKEEFEPGMRILDPACGTGSFLVEAFNRILHSQTHQDPTEILQMLQKIYGVEINPLSALITKLSLFRYLLGSLIRNSLIYSHKKCSEIIQKVTDNILVADFLMDRPNLNNFDLIVGNPPWLVINGIHSIPYKNKIKKLTEKYGLTTDTQNTSNIELSALFLRICVQDYLAIYGKIFFVTSAGIITGSQNDGLRAFPHLDNIRIWKFEKDLFNIHNICFYGEKIENEKDFGEDIENWSILVETKKCAQKPIRIEPGPIQKYLPIYVQDPLNSGSKCQVGRFIPAQNVQFLDENSKYRDLFRQGACLGPRNLIFCTEIPEWADSFEYLREELSWDRVRKKNEDLRLIIPDLKVQYKKYGAWDFKAYESAIVEKKYIHMVAKSTNLVPFFLTGLKRAFIPSEIFGDKNLGKAYQSAKNKGHKFQPVFPNDDRAAEHYQFLEQLYKKNAKSGNAISSLIQNMNHNNKLFNRNQNAELKLVYNGIGSIVKAALIKGKIIVDSSLYYYPVADESEGYYLVGVLNAPVVTELVTKMGSTGSNGSLRNIHKNPLDLHIPIYQNSRLQDQIGSKARDLQKIVLNILISYIHQRMESYLRKGAFCPKCGKIYTNTHISSHINRCKVDKDFSVLCDALKIITTERNSDVLPKSEINQALSTEFTNGVQNNPVSKVIRGLIKPKTVQNRIFEDRLFQGKLEELDQCVRKLIYNQR